MSRRHTGVRVLRVYATPFPNSPESRPKPNAERRTPSSLEGTIEQRQHAKPGPVAPRDVHEAHLHSAQLLGDVHQGDRQAVLGAAYVGDDGGCQVMEIAVPMDSEIAGRQGGAACLASADTEYADGQAGYGGRAYSSAGDRHASRLASRSHAGAGDRQSTHRTAGGDADSGNGDSSQRPAGTRTQSGDRQAGDIAAGASPESSDRDAQNVAAHAGTEPRGSQAAQVAADPGTESRSGHSAD